MQYADIDHMDERKIFTVDDVNFAGLNDYFVTLRSRGMRTIIILVGSWDSVFLNVFLFSLSDLCSL